MNLRVPESGKSTIKDVKPNWPTITKQGNKYRQGKQAYGQYKGKEEKQSNECLLTLNTCFSFNAKYVLFLKRFFTENPKD